MAADPNEAERVRQLQQQAARDYAAAEQQRQAQSNRDDAGLRAAEDAGADRIR